MSFEELKERQGRMWGSVPFEVIAAGIRDAHETIVAALDLLPGERLVDLACGTGELARLAAANGASVNGFDLAPALIETAKRLTPPEAGIEFAVGDCENLPTDEQFDVAASTFGIMFTPDQQRAASELARVVRPGGRIALANWTPDGSVGRMFAIASRYAPPPEGAGKPTAWGEPEHVRALLGDAFDLSFEDHVSTWRLESSDVYFDVMTENFGPFAALAANLPPQQHAEFRHEAIAFFETFREGGEIAHHREWLLVRGTRR